MNRRYETPPRWSRQVLRAAAAALALAPAGAALAAGTLQHEYSFNDNTGVNGVATDTLGTANGTLVNGASDTGNQLVTTGGGSGSAGTSPAASIPGAVAGITGDFSIETFFTAATTNAGFGTLFNFSNAANNTYFIATPNRSNTTGVSSIATKFNGGAELQIQGPNLNNNVQHQFLTTFTKSTGVVRLYVDGVFVNAGTVAGAANNFDLSTLTNRDGINGLSGFGDQALNGSNNEFRVYTGVVQPGTALLNQTLGTNTTTPTVNSFNAAGSADFNTGGNWSLGHVPTATAEATGNEQALIGNGGTATVTSGAASPNPTQVQITNGGLLVNGAGTVFTPAGGVDLAPGSGPGTAAVTVNGGGVLATPGLFADGDQTTTGTAAKTVTLDAGTLQANGAIIVGGTNLGFTMGAGGGTINTNGFAVTLNAPINGAGGLTKSGTGTLTLTGAGTYGGATAVNAGTLNFAAAAIPAGSNITLGSSTAIGTLQWAAGNTTDITAGRTVTIGGAAASTTTGAGFDTNGNNVTLTGNLVGSNTGALVKYGAGTLTLGGTYTPNGFFVRGGAVTLNGTVTTSAYSSIGQLGGDNGTLTVQGAGALTVTGDFNVADVSASTGSLFITTSGTVKATTLFVGKSGTDSGAVRQTNGTFSATAGTADWRLGGNGSATDANAVGVYDLNTAGTFNAPGNLQFGFYGKGQMTVGTGGTLKVANFPSVGRQLGSNGYLNVTGGTFNQTSTTGFLIVGEAGTGTLNLTAGSVNLSNTGAAQGLRIGNTAAATNVGYVNLVGGTLTTGTITTVAGSVSNLAFNGGTLRASASTATYLQGLTNAYVFPGGGTIDTQANNITIAQPLLAPPATNGVSSIPVTAGGTGYVATPIVQIVRATGDTTGSGAAAVATLNASGVVTGITITNPGTGYTANPVVTLVGGNPTTAATLGTVATLANAGTGGLNKVGTGILTLTGANTYSGGTTVTAGTLWANAPIAGTVSSSTGTGTVTITGTGTANAILGGTGGILGAVTINKGGIIAPGNSIGTLTVASPVTLGTGGTGNNPTYNAELGSGPSSDLLALTGTGASGLLTLSNPDVLNLLPTTPITTATTYTIATFASETGVFDSVLINGAAAQSADPNAANYALVTYNPSNIQVTVNNLSAVPEPASLGLFGVAAAGLLARRRHQRGQQ